MVLVVSLAAFVLFVTLSLVVAHRSATSPPAESEAEPARDGAASIPEIPDLDELDPLFAAAVRKAVAAIRRSPGDADAYGELGRLYHSHEYHDLARRCYALARRYDSRNADWPYYEGVLAMHAGRPGEAVEHFRAALRLRPGESATSSRLGEALLASGRTDEAAAQFRALVAAEPDAPWGYVGLGTAARRRGDLGEAARQLEEARRLDPRSREATYKLALTYGELGRREEAQRLMEVLQNETRASRPVDPLMERIRHGRTDLQSMIERANYLLDRGAFEPAKALYDTILAVDPRHFDAHFDLAVLHRRRRELAASERELRAALRIRPQSALAHHALATVLVDLRRFPEAIDELETTLRLDPAHEEARAALSMLTGGSR